MFNGTGSYWIGGDDYYSGPWTLFLTSDILGQELSICDTSPNLGLAGFQRRINNIAVSITNELRTGKNTSELVSGEVWKTQQYFQVQLYWLSVPGLLYIITTVLLFTTISGTISQNVPIWKSSPLVLLRCMDRGNDMSYLNEVEEKARKTGVELKYSGENWYLQNLTE
ncbi:hypothetical protein BS50DRAFT_677115 [Corynespora cassiicola Philippines]|uniref:Uncharacterized protein n=1 Tax=Corynespora cassiicola Philippines TaxID=1448308 RepID=A0A2T2NKG5_CORCC|nr:hypothetical protein BS50DRAFT_677115 [Corynespora cassiicola Philippines]